MGTERRKAHSSPHLLIAPQTPHQLNGYDFQASTLEKYQIWMQLADSQIDETNLAKWIEEKLVKIE